MPALNALAQRLQILPLDRFFGRMAAAMCLDKSWVRGLWAAAKLPIWDKASGDTVNDD